MTEDGERDWVSTAIAMQRLNTTLTTVRSMLIKGELKGSSDPVIPGRHLKRLVDPASIEDFIRENGRFPEAKRRKKLPSPASEARVAASTGAVSAASTSDTARLVQRVLHLEEVVRVQAFAMAEKDAAMTSQAAAAEHLRSATERQADAAKHLQAAEAALARLVGLNGIPDVGPIE